MYNKTILDTLFDAKNDFFALCAYRLWELIATVAFMAMIPWGRKFWLDAMHFLIILNGFVNIGFPEKICSPFIVEVEGELDSVHKDLIRGAGVLMLLWVISYWLLSRSTDSTVETSFVWVSAIMMTCFLICDGYLLTHQPKKGIKMDQKALTTAFYILMLYTLGTYYYAMKSQDWGGYAEVQSRSNIHLRLDFAALMVMGVLMFALPQWVLRLQTSVVKIDQLHAHLCRMSAVMLMGMSLMVGRSANFLRGADKEAIVFTHWVYYILLAGCSWYCRAKDISSMSWQSIGLFAFHDIAIIVNALGALNYDITTSLETVVSRLKAIPQECRMCCWNIRNRLKLKRY